MKKAENTENIVRIGKIKVPEGATIFLLVHKIDEQANEVFDKISETIKNHDIGLFMGEISAAKKYGVRFCIKKDVNDCVILEKDENSKRIKKYNRRLKRKMK